VFTRPSIVRPGRPWGSAAWIGGRREARQRRPRGERVRTYLLDFHLGKVKKPIEAGRLACAGPSPKEPNAPGGFRSIGGRLIPHSPPPCPREESRHSWAAGGMRGADSPAPARANRTAPRARFFTGFAKGFAASIGGRRVALCGAVGPP